MRLSTTPARIDFEASLYTRSDSRSNPIDLGLFSDPLSISLTDSVGFYDGSDNFAFSLSHAQNLNLSLTGLSDDADLYVFADLNSNGSFEYGELIAYSNSAGINAEYLSFDNLGPGQYLVQVDAYSGLTDYKLNLDLQEDSQGFSEFSIQDASGDSSANQVFQAGALRFNYDWTTPSSLQQVHIELWQGGQNLGSLRSSTADQMTDGLIDLSGFENLAAGNYQLRSVAQLMSGQEVASDFETLQILSWNTNQTQRGDFSVDHFHYNGQANSGHVFMGQGGTDTLDLSGVDIQDITSLNGQALNQFSPFFSGNQQQAIFQGTAFDYITLSDGREIYFQGIEKLNFSNGESLNLSVTPNDTAFAAQWNLHVSDVSSAWRFTQGSDDVLLVSLDSGILTTPGQPGGVHDQDWNRLIVDPSDDENGSLEGHGHQAINVMSATANNSFGIAGINWHSKVMVADVYGDQSISDRFYNSSVNLQEAILEGVNYAKTTGRRVVFQGGIQGENWLTDGSDWFSDSENMARLQTLISDNSDIALFAMAAGNGNVNVDDPYTDPRQSAGVARLQTHHNNVMAVGAARPGYGENQWWQTGVGITFEDSLINATEVSRASYSNYGDSLTMVAATDSPAFNKLGDLSTPFTGTSAANPNMAGIASLVWSVNPDLDAGAVRQILTDTAMDLGIAGRDADFGHGLVNADAAVRRAWALQQDSLLAGMHSGDSLLV